VLAPLTGAPVLDPALAARPVLAVKIENHPEARPQTGLAAADVVYEEVVEGSVTRFWAMFQTDAPETVGPIRSVRPMDPAIVSPLHGLVVFSGGTPPNVAGILGSPVRAINENNAGPAFFRLRQRNAPHNLYGRSAELWSRADGLPAPPPLFERLDTGGTCAGDPASSVHLGFARGYDPTWAWDPATGRYARSYGDTPFVDAERGQVTTENVLVQLVRYRGAGGAGELVGEGNGWAFCGGRGWPIHWSKPDNETPTAWTDVFGHPVRLAPGKTWVALLPVGAAVDVIP
jgi:hypothetical protein